MLKEGNFLINLSGLKKGKEYEYRAVVVQPQMSIYGNVEQANFVK